MPSAIPDAAAAHLPPARMIDPRGHRFGAGISAIILILAAVTGTPWLVARRAALDRRECGVRAALLDLRRRVAPHRRGRRPRQGRARARVPAPVRAGARQRRPDPGPGRVRGRRHDHRLGLHARRRGPADPAGRDRYCLGCRLYFLRWWVPDLVTRCGPRPRAAAHLRGGLDPLRLHRAGRDGPPSASAWSMLA